MSYSIIIIDEWIMNDREPPLISGATKYTVQYLCGT